MNTIVCNTLTGAVSEYTGFGFQSLTPTHAGSANGLFALGGDTDAGLPIVANIRLPRALRDTTLKKFPTLVWLSMKGAGSANLTVYGEQHEWSYSFQMQPRTGQTRCQVGRGIRENYYSLGISTPGGQAFSLDRVEVQHVESRSRRV